MFEKIYKTRREKFGAIISLEHPEALIYINEKVANMLKIPQPSFELPPTFLSAPLDVHFSLTSNCKYKCEGCYQKNLINNNNVDIQYQQAKTIIDNLSGMNVFTVAFGGGEPLLNNDLFQIATYTRNKKIIPTLTTSGYEITTLDPQKFRVFSNIHLSIHSLEDLDLLEKNISHLRKTGIYPGLNILLSRKTFPYLDDIFQFIKLNKIRKVLFLKFKINDNNFQSSYLKLSIEDEQKLYPILKKFSKKLQIKIIIDCSLFPAIAIHRGCPKRIVKYYRTSIMIDNLYSNYTINKKRPGRGRFLFM